MSKKKLIFIIAALLVLDQAVKIVVKTHMYVGQEIHVFSNWFIIRFIENQGAAFGFLPGGDSGKIVLSLFRIAAVVVLVWYLGRLIKRGAPTGIVVGFALITAGAAGNIFDSMFYGLIFDKGGMNPALYSMGQGIASLSTAGYGRFLHGWVVDMLWFPVWHGTYPSWFPWVGGERFLFFSPIFNMADSYITIGVIYMLLFQRRFFK